MKEKRKITKTNNEKFKTKKFIAKAGMVLAVAMLSSSVPQRIYANTNDTKEESILNDENNKTDLEKYFNCEVPMNEEYQVDVNSPIYKVIAFYEGKTNSIDGYYEIGLDPFGNPVIAGGLTLKYQNFLFDYLKQYGNDMQEISNNISKLINEGQKVLIPEDMINSCFISEIQTCRNGVIDAAKIYGINLSENQINNLTELNFRYGKSSANNFLQHLSNNGEIKSFYIKLNRSMSLEEYNATRFKLYNEVQSIENGIVNYTAYVKPFNALGMDASIDNLTSIDIQKQVESTENDELDGDNRRHLARQIGIVYDVFVEMINSSGECLNIETGEKTNITDYLESITSSKENNIQNNIENNIENNNENNDENTIEEVTKEENDILEETYEANKNDITSDYIEESPEDEKYNEQKNELQDREQEDVLDKQENTSLAVVKKTNVFKKFLQGLGALSIFSTFGAMIKNRKKIAKQSKRIKRRAKKKIRKAITISKGLYANRKEIPHVISEMIKESRENKISDKVPIKKKRRDKWIKKANLRVENDIKLNNVNNKNNIERDKYIREDNENGRAV